MQETQFVCQPLPNLLQSVEHFVHIILWNCVDARTLCLLHLLDVAFNLVNFEALSATTEVRECAALRSRSACACRFCDVSYAQVPLELALSGIYAVCAGGI